MARKPVPDDIQKEVLVCSARRCCICFGLHKKFDEVQGQIAHLDGNNSNNNSDNLAYLCLPCHDRYDSRTSQSKGLAIKEVKHYRDMLYEQVRNWRNEQAPGSISSFPNLAHQIWPLLAKNQRAFTSFGPNSGAESAAPVKWNLSLWEEARVDIILPSNYKIKDLIENNWDLVPEEYQSVFDRMLSHIYAFEKHCNDPALDYTEHQFPQDFGKIIDAVCSEEAERGTDIDELENWLATRFAEENLPVIEGYLIGSVLRGIFEGADVDVFLLLDNVQPDEIKTSGQKLERLKQLFFSEFGRSLHAIVFSQPESDSFYQFLGNLDRKKFFIQQQGK